MHLILFVLHCDREVHGFLFALIYVNAEVQVI